jgi:peptidoglycan/LPS O-acetylase OafA/YrhL
MSRTRTLSDAFDRKANGLNFLRFVLASGVIISHSVALTGQEFGPGPIGQVMKNVFVDGFFAISGYLIVSSWIARPKVGAYLIARALRIFPAFWICTIVTAAIFAPLSLVLAGQAFPTGFLKEAVEYPVRQALLRPIGMGQDIAGTPTDVPYPGVWNGSLWTLQWEFLCYFGVLALGVVGIVGRRSVSVAAFLGALSAVYLTSYGPVDSYDAVTAARFGLMFLAGVVVHNFRYWIPVSPLMMGAAIGLVVIASTMIDYRLVAALPIAYLLMTSGALLRSPRFRFKFDVSYGTYLYGVPVQQLLAAAGLWRAGVVPFAVISLACALPLAALSWRYIERPALALKVRRRRPVRPQEVPASQ